MKTANIRLPEAFGDRISFLRKLKGLTQAQLAEKLGKNLPVRNRIRFDWNGRLRWSGR